ncbi:MAG: molybdate ABC transporter permease subunit [Spirochaetota bacterium]
MNLFFPVFLSLRVAAIATVLTILVGLGLSRLLSRPLFPLRRFWETLILLPMVFPPTITGYLLLLLLGRRGPLGAVLASMGVSVIFTVAGAVIASFVVALPLMYQSCKSALAGVDHRVENAARSLGLSEGRIFRRVTLPLAIRGIISGTALSFARALGEFGATLMVAGNIPGRTATIPLALFDAVEGGRSAEANLLLGITVGLSFALVAVVGLAERRSGKTP